MGQFTPLSNNTQALVERWNGRRWTIEPFRLSGRPVSGALAGVSCPSSHMCMAVGQLEDPYGGTEGAVAARLAGRGWSTTSTPLGAGAANVLTSVVCSSSSACEAVGYRSHVVAPRRPLASTIAVERWNGLRWRTEAAPNPPGGPQSAAALSGLSCPSPRVCIAVGHAGQRLVIERRRTGRWSMMRVATPLGGGVLNAVSCASPSSCMAVGSTAADNPLAERWTGRRWRRVSTPASARGQELTAVACRSASACTAVSAASGTGINSYGDALLWRRGRWRDAPYPAPVNDSGTNQLDAVWCAAAGRCLAVGSGAGDGAVTTLAAVETGSSWRVVRTPNPRAIGGGSLNAVSCASATDCLAVGEFYDPLGNSRPLLERGTARAGWALEGASIAPAAPRGELDGVSCLPAGTCVAVGHSEELVEPPPVALRSRSGAPVRAGPAGSYQAGYPMNAVSCASESDCLAVGANALAVPSTPLLDLWNGTAWGTEGSAALPDGDTLSGVSCPSLGFCVAVGSVIATFNGLPEIAPMVTPLSGHVDLYGVDCVSPTWCVAVGSALSSTGAGTPIAEVWDGVAWTPLELPNPIDSRDTRVRAVSCTSPVACTAVGSYTTVAPYFNAFAATWDGTRWTLEKGVIPAGATQSALDGVSCTGPHACIAVGIDFAPTKTGILIERET